MKVNFQTKGIIITSKQKSIIERKISRIKKYLNGSEPSVVDVILIDQSGTEKGGVDQCVHLSVIIGKEKVFVEEVDNRIMRAFAYALERLERSLRRRHEKIVEKGQETGGGRLEKVFGILKRRKNKK